MNKRNILPILLFTVLPSLALWAQIAVKGTPLSFTETFQRTYQAGRLDVQRIAPVNVRQLQAEDEELSGARFAAPERVDLSPATAGVWTELVDGGALWRLKIESPGALGLAVLYDRFYLPPGATLYMYSEDRQQVLGAYTAKNNRANGKFLTGLIEGQAAVLEYYEPKAVAGQGQLHIFRIDRAYRKDFQKADDDNPFKVHSGPNELGFGNSLACHENANCTSLHEKQKRSVCRIMVVVEEGMGFCSGALLNNTTSDGTPYVMSAFHCQDGFTPMYDFWRFDFGYTSENCENPAEEPVPNSILGCSTVATRRENDLLLLELSSGIPTSFNVWFAGWNRQETPPVSAYALHHPAGDIMKYATINGGIKVFNFPIEWDNGVTTPARHHLELNYSTGTFEVGSSGSALFDPNGLTVGHLHGGNPSCKTTQAYYARLALAWEGGGTPESRLKDWLDPLNTGTMLLPGTENPGAGFGDISGVVKTEKGKPIKGVKITLDDKMVATDNNGQFRFEDIPMGEVYNLSLSRDGDAVNGLSTLDLIRISKHILGVEALAGPLQILAADVNVSGNISALDLIKIKKVILGVRDSFEEVPSWFFLPAGFSFTDPADPFRDVIPASYLITNFTEDIPDLDFTGVKYGDINGNADPGF